MRRSLAAALVNELFDNETYLKSNVRGRGKDKLDPKKKRRNVLRCSLVTEMEI